VGTSERNAAWAAIGVRLSVDGLESDEHFSGRISPADIEKIEVTESFLSPIVLVVPACCLLIVAGCVHVGIVRFALSSWKAWPVSLLFLGYGLHAFWSYAMTRVQSVWLTVPSSSGERIRFYVTESKDDAQQFVSTIQALRVQAQQRAAGDARNARA
jgi:hypothetical protein